MSNGLSARAPVIRPSRDHVTLEAWGLLVKILVGGTDTGGRYSMVDYVSPPNGAGPALHVHRELEETFYVLEGMLNFQIGDERTVGAPGTTIHAPPGVPHAFWNTGPDHAHFLIVQSPAFDQFFVELFEIARAHPVMTADIRPLLEKLNGKYDQVTVGPPPGLAPAAKR